MSHEVTIKTQLYTDLLVSMDSGGLVEIEIEDKLCRKSTIAWLTPEQWDQVVEAMAKARKEQA